MSYYYSEVIFSAGGVLFDPSNNKILLVYKKTSGEWLLPKGRIDEGETIEETASREIFEETGYKNKVGRLLSVQVRPDVNDPTRSKVIFWFSSTLVDGGKIEGTQEKDEDFTQEWCLPIDALSKLKWDDDKKLVRIAMGI